MPTPLAVLPGHHFILASTSPRRRELLGMLGVFFTVISPDSTTGNGGVDETPLPGEKPADLVQRLSRAKARAVLQALPLPVNEHNLQPVVIAADTVVVLGHKILGKPETPAQAISMLQLLRQQPHHVFSGLTVACPPHPLLNQERMITRLHQSTVWMRPYSDADIAAYVAGGSPLDKAGAYGIQDESFNPVERLEGCFASVMGFPLGELKLALKEIDISLPEIATICTQHNGIPCCQLATD